MNSNAPINGMAHTSARRLTRTSPGTVAGAVGDRRAAPPLAQLVLVVAVGEITERPARLRIAPRDLTARAVVPERPGRNGPTQSAHVRALVVALDDQSAGPVRGH